MSRQPWGIKPTVVKRIMSEVLDKGLGIKEVRFNRDGSFAIIPGQPAEAAAPNDLDRELEDFEARHGAAER
jgi:hypothetical protein